MIRVVCISDTHNWHTRIDLPPGDVLLHAGDATMNGSVSETFDFAKWISAQPHTHKVMVLGNHDTTGAPRALLIIEALMREAGVHLLDDELLTLANGLTIYGAPWHHSTDWLTGKRATAARWERVPPCHILLTHNPPLGIGDSNLDLGSHSIREALRRAQPVAHVFGHIHPGAGVYTYARDAQGASTTLCVNAAQCDDHYALSQKPTVFEIDLERNAWGLWETDSTASPPATSAPASSWRTGE